MKVEELLKQKASIESKIGSIDRAIHQLEAHSPVTVTVEVYANGGSNRSELSVEDVITAQNSRKTKLEEALEPINKKLDAIELMLNS
ncbi:hypothetical protein VPH219E481_0035 [Vibrio phage 219E48-1]|nr:hypothetical protein PODOV021v1_p0023 [Vibrio phage 219E41.2]QZI91019.1 hypothetical protein PODOV032v1_p0014 [Vibrio phage 219E41.1]QZI91164.1 hypothetical protein PODOV060v1_p0070 [Vibrio phage 234P8]QZI91544.1 hypothetical protein PODOV087v1_p0039 [Vibrio phage 431E45.1]QZI91594.1 hypothetical protein PODOV086v1_p0010 [Vibrio phage 431E46.1]QZI91704.1 hypothetical protein PODOV088v1_p0043 [Vibrio phage 431E48.2]